jgi:hypothetical protein
MSSTRKNFVAVCVAASDYDTHYGVVTIRYGDYQRLKELQSLIGILQGQYSDVDGIKLSDTMCLWFEGIPWKAGLTDKEQEETEAVERDITDGIWLTVDETLLDDENGSPVRTNCDSCDVDRSSLHFSFYEKHGDFHYGSPYLSIADLDTHFGGD